MKISVTESGCAKLVSGTFLVDVDNDVPCNIVEVQSRSYLGEDASFFEDHFGQL